MLDILWLFVAFVLLLGGGQELRAARESETRAGRIVTATYGLLLILFAASLTRSVIVDVVARAVTP